MTSWPSASVVCNAPLAPCRGSICVPIPLRGNASIVATARGITWVGTSNARRASPPAMAVSESTTLLSLSCSAGKGAVDAAAGPVCACSIGCSTTGAVRADAGAPVSATTGAVLPGPGCMPLRTSTNPATTRAIRTMPAMTSSKKIVCSWNSTSCIAYGRVDLDGRDSFTTAHACGAVKPGGCHSGSPRFTASTAYFWRPVRLSCALAPRDVTS